MEVIVLIVCFLTTQAFPMMPEVTNAVNTNAEINDALQKINALKYGKSRTFGTLTSFALGGLMAALDFVEEIIDENNSVRTEGRDATRQRRQEETSTENMSTTEAGTTTTELTTTDLASTTTFSKVNDSLNEVDSDRIRLIREETSTSDKNNTVKGREDDDDEDEGGGGGLLGAILSGFLGSLSKPDGGVDINAVVSVIGSLSAAQEDGSYDFAGLTDTLSAFFGGGDDGGGSDVGSFVGGLAAASIAGIASPPGAKGTGSFVGNLLRKVLPALSAPAPVAGGDAKPQQGDSGGFLFSLLNSLFGTPADANTPNPPFSLITIKMNIIKFLFSTISSILASSSAGSKGAQ